jgi:hypothetical protein
MLPLGGAGKQLWLHGWSGCHESASHVRSERLYFGRACCNSARALATSSRAALSARRWCAVAMEWTAWLASAPTGTLMRTNSPGASGGRKVKTPNRNSSGLLTVKSGTPSPLMGCWGLWRAARICFSDAEEGSDCCALTEMTPPDSAMMTTSSVRETFRVPCDLAPLTVIGGHGRSFL